MKKLRLAARVTLIAILACPVQRAYAGEPDTELPTATSDDIADFRVGISNYRAANFIAAEAAFARVYARTRSIEALWNYALASLEAGHASKSRELFLTYVRAPSAKRDRIAKASDVYIPRAEGGLARIIIKNPAADTVRIDDREYSAAEASAGVVVEPGRHDVRVNREGSPITSTVSVQARGEYVITMAPPPAQPAARPSTEPKPRPPLSRSETTDPAPGRGLAVAAILLTAGGAAAAGTYFTVSANSRSSKADELSSRTNQTPCLFYGSNSCEELINSREGAAADSSAARAFFVASGILASTVPLLLIAWPSRRVEVRTSAHPSGAAGLSLVGTF